MATSPMRPAGLPERLPTPPPFVGRQRQLELLERCLAEAVAGCPRVVLLSGEAGIGKSRLLREARAQADHLGMQVAYGRCAEDLALPYLPFVEALEAPLRETLGPDAEALRLLLHRDAAGAPNGSAATEQLQLFRAVAQACVTLAQHRTTMLVIEDLHWADRSTIDLLQHVVFTVTDEAARRPVPLLVVATYRAADADERLSRAVARLRREDIVLPLDLPGLDEPEIDALIRRYGLGAPTHQLVTTLAATTRGNPLFVEELLHDLLTRGALRRRGGFLAADGDLATARAPEELTAMIAARIAPLSPRCRDVLGAAALLGARFAPGLLAAVSEIAEVELLGLLEEATRQRVLAGDGESFEFQHPLVRHVLSGELSGARAQRLHLRIAETLERMQSRADDQLLAVTHHLIAAGPAADPRTVRHAARQAGERALAMSAWADAARYFEAALAAAAAHSDCPLRERAALHHRAAFAYWRDLDAGPCLEQYELAITAYRQLGDVRELARAVAEQTRAHVMLASAPYGALVDVEPLRAALAGLGNAEPLLRAQCLASMALAYWIARRPAEAERAAREALECGAGDDRMLADAYHALALAQLHAMRQDEALESWERSRAHAQQAGDRWLEGVALQRIPTALVGLGRLGDAERTAMTACELGRETQNWAGCSVALGNLVLVAVATGNFAAAEDRAREALTMVRRARYGWAAPYLLPALACARVLRGAPSEAADAMTILATPGEVFDDPGPAVQLLAWVYQQVIGAYAGTLDEDARNRLRRLAGAGAPAEIVNLAGMSALIEAGDVTDDDATASGPYRELRVAAERGVVMTIGWVFLIDRILGVAAARGRMWDEAERHFAAAIATARRIGAAPELARGRLDYCRMLTERGAPGDRERALELLRQAHAGCEELGITSLAARSAQLAAELDEPLPQAASGGESGELDARDLDVLRRVARGRSVAEIAGDLTVAPASAEQQIRAVLRKISVRADAPARARRGAAGAAPAPGNQPLVIMFTDMEGSTAAIERLGDARAHHMQRVHDSLIRSALVVHGGAEVSHTGDGLLATFRSASGAVACAVAIQRAFAAHSRAHPELPIRVRIGLNAGEPIAERELLFGAAVNLAARICGRARGGQILVADVVRQLAAGKGGEFIDRGRVSLKGFRGRFRTFEVPWQDGE